MDELVTINSSDLQKPNPRWNPIEWIGCHRSFQNIPDFVAIEAVRAVCVPPDIQGSLPPKDLSPSEFFTDWLLPHWDAIVDSADDINFVEVIGFDVIAPTDIPGVPSEDVLLPLAVVNRLANTFGQAWFDGMLSIRDARDPDHVRYYDFWYLTYARELRAAARSYSFWSRVMDWVCADRDVEEPDEAKWREKALGLLSSIPGWTGDVGCKLFGLTYEDLANLLGENQLAGGVLDALMLQIGRRLKQKTADGSSTIIAEEFFATCLAAGATDQTDHFGSSIIRRYENLLQSTPRPTRLVLLVHHALNHWLACRVNISNGRIQFGDGFRQNPPKELSKGLAHFLKRTTGKSDPVITKDLPCGVQKDIVNCGIIAVNALAHDLLGDALWESSRARTYRYEAFCTIADIILTYNNQDAITPAPIEISAGTDSDVSMQETRLTDDDVGSIIEFLSETASKRARADQSDSEDNADEPAAKRPKGARAAKKATGRGKSSKGNTNLKQPRMVSNPPAHDKGSSHDRILAFPREVQYQITEAMRNGGKSTSAIHDRVVRVLIQHGLFRASPRKLEALRAACKKGGDPNPGLDPKNPKQVICSHCHTVVQLQSVYQAQRFLDHLNNPKTCKVKPVEAPSNSIASFFKPVAGGTTTKKVATRPHPNPVDLGKLCPGLTGAIHPRIDYYIENCPATGAGAREINHYVKLLFARRFKGIESVADARLTKEDREKAYHHQSLDRRWRIETSPHRASVVSAKCLVKFTVQSQDVLEDPTVVCEACWEVYLLREFRNAINRSRDKPHAKAKCTPKLYSNPIQSRVMARYHGLEEFLAERSELSPFARFAIAVGEGKYKDNKVFLGLVETMQMATERQLKGVSMRNFKYPLEFREWGSLLHMTSPRAYRNMAQHFRMETPRSIKNQASKRPRFPIGITPETFGHLQTYLENYGYPSDYPLCISVDDTKLLPAMHPLYDGPEKMWYLIGLPGQKQLRVTSPEELERLMEQNHSPATKLRLWAAAIPFPGIPPLALAILPISSTIKAPELVVHQLTLLNGLIDRNYRFISNVADGAAVERDCQTQVAAKGVKKIHLIRPPVHLPDEPALSIPLYNLRGNLFVNTQDAPHARKTGRNNIFSGARGLILGDYPVYYKQLRDLAVDVADPPLYERDVIRADKQDDRAALRVFSAATLQKLTENIERNMGLIVFLFVIGELIDAYESRTMTHASRAKAALRARLFFKTWKLFLGKQGYSLARNYISAAADAIYDMLIDGLLGLILIHRDHLSRQNIPLLLWKHESMGNERIFSALRELFPDMSLAQVMFALPRIRVTMSAAKRALFSKGGLKESARGYCFSDTADDDAIDLVRLATFPTDDELTGLYGEAIEENHTLWSLLNVNLYNLTNTPTIEVAAAPADKLTDPDHLAEDEVTGEDAAIVDLCIRDELQEALAAVQDVVGLLRSEENEIDACAYAAAALVVDSLALIDNLPQLDDPAHLELCRQDMARMLKAAPETVGTLLSGLQASFGGSSRALDVVPPPPPPFADITQSELQPLVEIRQLNQTEDARKGVRSFKGGAGTIPLPETASTASKKPAEPTQKQILARRIQAIIRDANVRKATTGLNRKARTEQPEDGMVATHTEKTTAGNAANAAAAAEVRASAATQRRASVFKNLQCKSDVSSAGISPVFPLAEKDYAFVIEAGTILLARVITLYSKGAGKAGKHDYVDSVNNIGRVSYAFVQTYAHRTGRMYQRVHSASAALNISRFAHLPAGSILFRIPDDVTRRDNVVEVSSAMALKYKKFQSEQRGLVAGVTTLNTVQRRGKSNINVVNIEEEDDVEA
ncbi:hypothetical protein B0H11DRAFT_2248676 [Mycena galericulata]|nr:hypothetical protein B0H11DRAFT_2248671 [Mycena galericulata]KAJ7446905.1 hypothetical protein B0H11DRAFT_2248676 [Mycena galericulata]